MVQCELFLAVSFDTVKYGLLLVVSLITGQYIGDVIYYCAMWAIYIKLCLAVSFLSVQCGLYLAVSFMTV